MASGYRVLEFFDRIGLGAAGDGGNKDGREGDAGATGPQSGAAAAEAAAAPSADPAPLGSSAADVKLAREARAAWDRVGPNLAELRRQQALLPSGQRERYSLEHARRLTLYPPRRPYARARDTRLCSRTHPQPCPHGCKTCHFCRQRLVERKTSCAGCEGRNNYFGGPGRGYWCGSCLWLRAGENLDEVIDRPDWRCPACRDICNCSGANCQRLKRGWFATNQLAHEAAHMGFLSVAHYLVLTLAGATAEAAALSGAGNAAAARAGGRALERRTGGAAGAGDGGEGENAEPNARGAVADLRALFRSRRDVLERASRAALRRARAEVAAELDGGDGDEARGLFQLDDEAAPELAPEEPAFGRGLFSLEAAGSRARPPARDGAGRGDGGTPRAGPAPDGAGLAPSPFLGILDSDLAADDDAAEALAGRLARDVAGRRPTAAGGGGAGARAATTGGGGLVARRARAGAAEAGAGTARYRPAEGGAPAMPAEGSSGSPPVASPSGPAGDGDAPSPPAARPSAYPTASEHLRFHDAPMLPPGPTELRGRDGSRASARPPGPPGHLAVLRAGGSRSEARGLPAAPSTALGATLSGRPRELPAPAAGEPPFPASERRSKAALAEEWARALALGPARAPQRARGGPRLGGTSTWGRRRASSPPGGRSWELLGPDGAGPAGTGLGTRAVAARGLGELRDPRRSAIEPGSVPGASPGSPPPRADPCPDGLLARMLGDATPDGGGAGGRAASGTAAARLAAAPPAAGSARPPSAPAEPHEGPNLGAAAGPGAVAPLGDSGAPGVAASPGAPLETAPRDGGPPGAEDAPPESRPPRAPARRAAAAARPDGDAALWAELCLAAEVPVAHLHALYAFHPASDVGAAAAAPVPGLDDIDAEYAAAHDAVAARLRGLLPRVAVLVPEACGVGGPGTAGGRLSSVVALRLACRLLLSLAQALPPDDVRWSVLPRLAGREPFAEFSRSGAVARAVLARAWREGLRSCHRRGVPAAPLVDALCEASAELAREVSQAVEVLEAFVDRGELPPRGRRIGTWAFGPPGAGAGAGGAEGGGRAGEGGQAGGDGDRARDAGDRGARPLADGPPACDAVHFGDELRIQALADLSARTWAACDLQGWIVDALAREVAESPATAARVLASGPFAAAYAHPAARCARQLRRAALGVLSAALQALARAGEGAGGGARERRGDDAVGGDAAAAAAASPADIACAERTVRETLEPLLERAVALDFPLWGTGGTRGGAGATAGAPEAGAEVAAAGEGGAGRPPTPPAALLPPPQPAPPLPPDSERLGAETVELLAQCLALRLRRGSMSWAQLEALAQRPFGPSFWHRANRTYRHLATFVLAHALAHAGRAAVPAHAPARVWLLALLETGSRLGVWYLTRVLVERGGWEAEALAGAPDLAELASSPAAFSSEAGWLRRARLAGALVRAARAGSRLPPSALADLDAAASARALEAGATDPALGERVATARYEAQAGAVLCALFDGWAAGAAAGAGTGVPPPPALSALAARVARWVAAAADDLRQAQGRSLRSADLAAAWRAALPDRGWEVRPLGEGRPDLARGAAARVEAAGAARAEAAGGATSRDAGAGAAAEPEPPGPEPAEPGAVAPEPAAPSLVLHPSFSASASLLRLTALLPGLEDGDRAALVPLWVLADAAVGGCRLEPPSPADDAVLCALARAAVAGPAPLDGGPPPGAGGDARRPAPVPAAPTAPPLAPTPPRVRALLLSVLVRRALLRASIRHPAADRAAVAALRLLERLACSEALGACRAARRLALLGVARPLLDLLAAGEEPGASQGASPAVRAQAFGALAALAVAAPADLVPGSVPTGTAAGSPLGAAGPGAGAPAAPSGLADAGDLAGDDALGLFWLAASGAALAAVAAPLPPPLVASASARVHARAVRMTAAGADPARLPIALGEAPAAAGARPAGAHRPAASAARSASALATAARNALVGAAPRPPQRAASALLALFERMPGAGGWGGKGGEGGGAGGGRPAGDCAPTRPSPAPADGPWRAAAAALGLLAALASTHPGPDPHPAFASSHFLVAGGGAHARPLASAYRALRAAVAAGPGGEPALRDYPLATPPPRARPTQAPAETPPGEAIGPPSEGSGRSRAGSPGPGRAVSPGSGPAAASSSGTLPTSGGAEARSTAAAASPPARREASVWSLGGGGRRAAPPPAPSPGAAGRLSTSPSPAHRGSAATAPSPLSRPARGRPPGDASPANAAVSPLARLAHSEASSARPARSAASSARSLSSASPGVVGSEGGPTHGADSRRRGATSVDSRSVEAASADSREDGAASAGGQRRGDAAPDIAPGSVISVRAILSRVVTKRTLDGAEACFADLRGEGGELLAQLVLGQGDLRRHCERLAPGSWVRAHELLCVTARPRLVLAATPESRLVELEEGDEAARAAAAPRAPGRP